MAKIWTEENEEFIRENFRHKTYAELADLFGVTQKAMESKIRRMGLKKQDYRDPDPVPAMLPPRPLEPARPPVETGPMPIKSARLLARRVETPRESPGDRKARLQAQKEAAQTEKTLRESLRKDTVMARALKSFEAGLKQYHDGALGKAIESFRKVVDSCPPDPVLRDRARQYGVAITRQGRGRQFVPQDADDYYLVGVVALNDGQPAQALSAFEQALSRAPGDDRILFCRAAAHAQKGDIDAAIDALREAVEINDANRIYAVNDPDFVPLRVHEDFRSIVSGEH